MSSSVQEFQCACKKVTAQITGEPKFQAYCHCVNCRDWYQRTPVSLAIYPWDSVQITKGSDSVATVSLVNPELERLFCKNCGYRLNTQSAQAGVKILCTFNLHQLNFKPKGHLFCKDTSKDSLMHFKDDGLPKWSGASPALGDTDDRIEL